MELFEKRCGKSKGLRLMLIDLDDNDAVIKDVKISAFVGAVAIKDTNTTAQIQLLHGSQLDYMAAMTAAQEAVDATKEYLLKESPIAKLIMEVMNK